MNNGGWCQMPTNGKRDSKTKTGTLHANQHACPRSRRQQNNALWYCKCFCLPTAWGEEATLWWRNYTRKKKKNSQKKQSQAKPNQTLCPPGPRPLPAHVHQRGVEDTPPTCYHINISSHGSRYTRSLPNEPTKRDFPQTSPPLTITVQVR